MKKKIIIGVVVVLLLIAFLVFVQKSRWSNNITPGLSTSEQISFTRLYLETVNQLNAGWVGVNFFLVHKENAAKFHDNIYYQSGYIDTVGHLKGFRVRDHGEYLLFFWLNYYPENPSVNFSNARAFFDAFIVAAMPMLGLVDRYDWFAVEQYDRVKGTGVVLPESVDDVPRELAYKKFQKYPSGENCPILEEAKIEYWVDVIAGEPDIETPSILSQMITVHKDRFAQVHQSIRALSTITADRGGVLLKYGVREHEDYYNIVLVEYLSENTGLSSADSSKELLLKHQKDILSQACIYERVLVDEAQEDWPSSYDAMQRLP